MICGKYSNYPTYSLIYEVGFGFVLDFSVISILPTKLEKMILIFLDLKSTRVFYATRVFLEQFTRNSFIDKNAVSTIGIWLFTVSGKFDNFQ